MKVDIVKRISDIVQTVSQETNIPFDSIVHGKSTEKNMTPRIISMCMACVYGGNNITHTDIGDYFNKSRCAVMYAQRISANRHKTKDTRFAELYQRVNDQLSIKFKN